MNTHTAYGVLDMHVHINLCMYTSIQYHEIGMKSKWQHSKPHYLSRSHEVVSLLVQYQRHTHTSAQCSVQQPLSSKTSPLKSTRLPRRDRSTPTSPDVAIINRNRRWDITLSFFPTPATCPKEASSKVSGNMGKANSTARLKPRVAQPPKRLRTKRLVANLFARPPSCAPSTTTTKGEK